jgi:predicted RNA-binding Zn ribbon-like protein
MGTHPIRPLSDWQNGFLFLGNQLALDLLNTRPLLDARPTELLPDFEALLRWFIGAQLLRSSQAAKLRRDWGGTARARQALHAVHELRERLRTEVLAWEQGGAVRQPFLDALNRLLARRPMHAHIRANRDTFSTELRFDAQDPENLLAPVAHSIAMLFAHSERSRVRRCGACVLHFYDNSKKGNRRWCSMQLCGNRLKVAAYARRQRLPGVVNGSRLVGSKKSTRRKSSG